MFATGAPLPAGYGAGFDERLVEFPWALAQGLGGRVLDAGSTLNHAYVLDAVMPEVDEQHVVTLAPEPRAFWQRGISYVFADLRELPYRDGWFDSVVSLSVLEHVGMDNALYGAGSDRASDVAAATADAVREPGASWHRAVSCSSASPTAAPRTTAGSGSSARPNSRSCVRAPARRRRRSRSSSTAAPAGAGRRPLEAGAVTYRDWRSDGRALVPDRAAAARAVACLRFTF